MVYKATFNLPNQSPTHRVIEFQEPTAANNYTWYRKYDDGWVEQGGIVGQTTPSATITINIPVEMADTNYMLTGGAVIETNGATDHREGANEYISKSTTLFQKFMWQRWTSFWWKIEGVAASGSTQQNIMCIKY